MSYLSLSDKDKKEMLARTGVGTVDDLFCCIPEAVRLRQLLDLPPAQSELELVRTIDAVGRKNAGTGYVSFLGGGAYEHFIPTVVDYLSSRGEFVSPYTPYQPEVSQGTLQATIQHHVVSANEWLYPDTPIPASPVRSAEILAARGGRAGFQVLLRGLKAGDPLAVHYDGGVAPEIYQLVDVNVPENSGPPCSAIPPDRPTPDYVTRKAPYRVYEALRPLRNGDPARAETDALYVSFRIPRDATPGSQRGRLAIQTGRGNADIAVSLSISASRVPEKGNLRVTNWFSTAHMARLHGVEPWSEAHWDLLLQYARMMRRGRQTDFIPVRPEVKKASPGAWQFDFSRTRADDPHVPRRRIHQHRASAHRLTRASAQYIAAVPLEPYFLPRLDIPHQDTSIVASSDHPG